MESKELSDVLQRLERETIPRGSSMLTNFEFDDCPPFSRLADHEASLLLLPVHGSSSLLLRATGMLPPDTRWFIFLYHIHNRVQVEPSEGFRIFSSDSRLSIQYMSAQAGNVSEIAGRLSTHKQLAPALSSVTYHVLPLPGDLSQERVTRYFDRLPPLLRQVPRAPDIISALQGNGWLLYRLGRSNEGALRIYARQCPAEKMLLIGEPYQVVPRSEEPYNAAAILAAQQHVRATNQGLMCPAIEPVLNPIIQNAFVRRMIFSSGMIELYFEPGVSVLVPYTTNTPQFFREHWTRYDQLKMPAFATVN